MDHHSTLRKNPSRETCEKEIKRILMMDVLENGQNRHFKSAADFMKYFESLYPASDALTKQVQRAVKAMNMARDENGYFMVNKTPDQLEQENEIRRLFELAHVSVHPMEQCETVFLTADAHVRRYLMHIMQTTNAFQEKFLTVVETANGLLFYTDNKNQLLVLLNSLTI